MALTNLTRDLTAWQAGDKDAEARVLNAVYEELRIMGRAFLAKERGGHTLQGTGLANEAFMRLLPERTSFANRAHFFWAASRAMRRILADSARRKLAGKRGGDVEVLPLDEALAAGPVPWDPLALHQALDLLARVNPRHARVMDYKLYGGFTNGEIAGFLDVTEKTIERDITLARGWLKRKLA